MDYDKLAKEIKEINEHCLASFKKGIDISSYAANKMLVAFIIEENLSDQSFDAEKFRELSGYKVSSTKQEEMSSIMDNLLSKQVKRGGF